MDLRDGTLIWQDYNIRIGERDMFWVSKNGINPMPGACCFSSEADAKKGIAALIVAMAIVGPDEPPGPIFWNLIELTK